MRERSVEGPNKHTPEPPQSAQPIPTPNAPRSPDAPRTPTRPPRPARTEMSTHRYADSGARSLRHLHDPHTTRRTTQPAAANATRARDHREGPAGSTSVNLVRITPPLIDLRTRRSRGAPPRTSPPQSEDRGEALLRLSPPRRRKSTRPTQICRFEPNSGSSAKRRNPPSHRRVPSARC